MALTRPPLDMIQASGTAGEVLTVGSNNGVSTSSTTSTTSPYPIGGGFNDVNGTLTLKLSDNTTVAISGMPTTSSMGQGQTGLPGTNGVNGVPGRDGTNGTNGAVGACGPQGADGPVGPAGPIGATGATGPQGPQGQQGPAGPTGPQGIQGNDGADGPQGASGPEGPPGAIGLPGPPGPTGAPGTPGVQGAPGNDGPAGVQGPQGPAGPIGQTGNDGATGPVGAPGTAGTNGVNGVGTGGTGVPMPLGANGTSLIISSGVMTWGSPTVSLPALTGDVTLSTGSTVTALAPSGVTAGSYGSATQIPVLTINAKGIVTSASTITATGGTGGASGTGLSSRNSVTYTATGIQPYSIAAPNLVNTSLTAFKSYALLSIQTTDAAWVRIYSSAAAQLADAGRLQTTDPLPGSGVLCEIITTGSQTILMTPAVIGFSSESTPTVSMPITIANNTTNSANITVTFSLLQLEV